MNHAKKGDGFLITGYAADNNSYQFRSLCFWAKGVDLHKLTPAGSVEDHSSLVSYMMRQEIPHK